MYYNKGKVQFDYFASVNKGQLVEDTYLSQLADTESIVCLLVSIRFGNDSVIRCSAM